MIMTNIIGKSSQTEKYLREGLYQLLAEYYESLLEEETAIFTNYWYLGLAYLLQGQEEKAQLTWFMILNELPKEKMDQEIQVLIKILDDEATILEKEEKYQLAWLIRRHIQELAENDLNNLIQLICLDIKINNFDVESFQAWNIAELISVEEITSISIECLNKALNHILYLVCPDSLGFAKFCLKYPMETQSFMSIIVQVSNSLAFRHRNYSHAADLIKICLEIKPNDLYLLKTLCSYYADGGYYNEALSVAGDFLKQCQSLSTKTFGTYQLLNIYLNSSNWFEVMSTAKDFMQLLELLVIQKPIVIEDFLIPNTSMLVQSLLHIDDQPRTNRYLFNQLSNYFQEITRNNYSFKNYSGTHSLSQNRPLKIGYISSLIKVHSVSWLSRWLISHHDKENFDCHIYSLSTYSDWLTEIFIKENPSTSFVFDYNPEEAAKKIQEDEIDILVDLDSVTSNVTYQVMALKPAPIQVTWLGYDASGIPAIDYFIADPYVLPENAQDYYSEKIWRLPHTYIGVDGFEISVPTLKREDLNIEKDAIIFMSVQGSLKRHPDIIRLQMRIIKNVPNSYLLLKGKGDPVFTETLYNQLAKEEGVNVNRLRFLEMSPTELEHRANLSIADVILDTYPYNGATTTLETLWMEKPLVTRVGEQFAARNSYSFMMNTDVTEGIAWSDEEYVEWGIKLGTDAELRKKISWKLRQSKKTSPLWSGKKFAREMENAYQQMWEIYTQGKL